MKPIHGLTILLLTLCLSPFASAQAGVTLLVKTDMTCDWKLDGQPMGLLRAGNPTVVLVSPGEHQIEASTSAGQVTSRTAVQVDNVEKTVDLRLRNQVDQPQAGQAAAPAATARHSTWTDPATGLMWTGKDNGSDVDWAQANAYCSKLQLAGYRNWRLPTIDELQGIYDPHIGFKVKFDNGITYNVHVKGNLQLTGWTWSSTQGDGVHEPWQQARLLNFGLDPIPDYTVEGSGTHNFMIFTYTMRALCVRPAGE